MNYLKLSSLLIYIILISKINISESLKILGIFPLHGKSHFVMCERLAKGLVERGHTIDVYSHFPLKKSIKNYRDYSLAGSLPPILNNMSYDFFQEFREPNMALMQEVVGKPICDLLDLPLFKMLLTERLKYDVVLVEVFIANCFLAMGRHFDIPMVGVVTAHIFDWLHDPLGNPYNTAVTPGAWSEYQRPMNFRQRLQNTIEYYMIKNLFNYHIKEQDQQVKKYFGPNYPSVVDLPKDIDLLLVNSHHSLNGIVPLAPAVKPVGGLHVVDDGTKLPTKLQKWLDESKDGFIYFSFGSMVRIETFPKHYLDAFYKSFENIAPVRILMKIAKPEELPEGLPDNVLTQTWLSQVQVLKHKNIKAFITHGGLMGTQEAIAYGVPMIGVPLFGDQSLNIKLYVRKRVAVMLSLKNITEENFTNSIKEILNNKEYSENVKKLSKDFFDRPMDPMNESVYWIEYIARHGKGTLRAPIVDMPWWQSSLLDIYAFILSVALFILYVFKFILRKLINIFMKSNNDELSSKKRR